MPSLSLSEQDFYTWSSKQAQAVANRQVERLDWEHLAQEKSYGYASQALCITSRPGPPGNTPQPRDYLSAAPRFRNPFNFRLGQSKI
ncbi:DUF29 family protein [Thermosynechococcaceae cyanobacterium BACA0444]|uniref:DUF29 family protein n=1 Tax=Pseudocalidococcus azoricus BACA0444 TaxID=2918990 RepID=A0AAE4FNB9_9CYAN|nr:DUF29 family protein [Pseudocalidococcus azoricus BACA0444]